MRVPKASIMWFFIMVAGAAIAATTAMNSAAAKAVAIGVGGFIAGIGFLKLLLSKPSES